MLKLRDIMTSEVHTLGAEDSLRDALGLLAGRHLGGAPVLSGDKVVGVLSMTSLLDFQASTPPVPSGREDQLEWGDFEEEPREWESEDEPPGTFFTELWTDAGAETSERFASVRSSEWDLLAEHTVSEAMERRIHAMPPDTPVTVAADEMRRLGLHRLLVMEGPVLVGIVTTMDITKAVADHRLVVRQYVFDRRGRRSTR